MSERGTPRRGSLLSFRRDRRGVALIEAGLVLPPFLTLLFLVIEVGIYFTEQSALDVGVLTTAETLRVNMLVGSSYSPPTAAVLKAAIITNGGAMLTVTNLAVDVHQLAALSSGVVAVTDGSDDWGGSGSILIIRAQTTMPFLPGTSVATMLSTSVIRRPPY